MQGKCLICVCKALCKLTVLHKQDLKQKYKCSNRVYGFKYISSGLGCEHSAQWFIYESQQLQVKQNCRFVGFFL